MAGRVRSVLWLDPDAIRPAELDDAGHLRDLNLDQVLDAIASDRWEYGIGPWLRQRLATEDEVRLRQQVFTDFERPDVRAAVDAFANGMRLVRRRRELVDRLNDPFQARRWFLDIVLGYCACVADFAAALRSAAPRSPALRAAEEDVAAYVASDDFTALGRRAGQLRDEFAAIRYELDVHQADVTVRRADGDAADFGAHVLDVFDRFRPAAPRDYRTDLAVSPAMDHVESDILGAVAQLYPHEFDALGAFRRDHADLVPADVQRLDRELQFYAGVLDHLRPLREAGLPTCLPQVTATAFDARDVYDLALAGVRRSAVPRRWATTSGWPSTSGSWS